MAGPALDLTHVLGLSAGVAILLLGVFVLVARPRATLNRAFFLLAFFDGASNLLFELRYMASEPAMQRFFMATYFWYFLAFIALFVSFGLLFPKPFIDRRVAVTVCSVVGGLAAIGLTMFARDHAVFYTLEEQPLDTTLRFRAAAGYNYVATAFAAFSFLVIAKLARDVRADGARTERRQAAFALGGLVVGFAPYFLTPLVTHVLSSDGHAFSEHLFAPRFDQRLVFWSYIAEAILFPVIAAYTLWGPGRQEPFVRRFLLVSILALLPLLALSIFVDNGFVVTQIVGLLAYPALLAYAILGAEAFDINPQLRRATTLTLVGAGVATVFVLLENFLQGYLAETVLDFVASDFTVSIISALIAAAIVLPTLAIARKLTTRLVPIDAEHVKNLATYRMVLESALADGLLDARESRTLDTLRQSLGVSTSDHERLTVEVRARAAAATQD